MNVVIVEDQAESANELRMILTARGHVVTTVTHDFTRLLEGFPWERIDVLVCDLVLSAHVTGVEVLIAARLQNPQVRRVVLSGAQPHHLDTLTGFAEVLLDKPALVGKVIAAIEGDR